MSDIKLNFINRANDVNNSDVIIFQKNVATDFDELSVAWQVIQNCGQGDNHPFVYPMSMEVGASDSWGNFTPKMTAQNGQLFHVALSTSGDTLSLAGACSSREVQVRNDLAQGSINANIYKSGKLLATKTNIVPAQKAVFEFKPTIWIGLASQIEEGQVINSAILTDINTELSLLGISSADIVMTGGGSGTGSSPYQFNLENVVMS